VRGDPLTSCGGQSEREGVRRRRYGRERLRRAAPLIAIVGGLASLAATPVSDPFVQEKSGVVIDWRAGTVAVTAGAAADLRMPSADIARPGAERRARAAARVRIAEALRALPLGGGRRLDEAAVARAVARARTTSTEYQSNGGVVVRMEVAFGDWAAVTPPAPLPPGTDAVPTEAAPVALWLAEGRFAAAPLVVVGGREITLGSAKYTTASALPTGVRPLTVHVDKIGRLVVEGNGNQRELAGRPAVIYLQKNLR
jgi:hypothetical protein